MIAIKFNCMDIKHEKILYNPIIKKKEIPITKYNDQALEIHFHN